MLCAVAEVLAHPCGSEAVPGPAPGYEEVLEGLRGHRISLLDWIEVEVCGPADLVALDAAIHFLESLPESVKWSEMPGDTAFRCMECDWYGCYRDLQKGACPNCADQVEPL